MDKALGLVIGTDVGSMEAVFAFIDRFCAEVAVPGEITPRLKVATEELVVNIIDHGFDRSPDGRIELTLLRLADGVRLTVADNGPPFDPFAAAAPPACEFSLEDRPVGGLGIHLVRSMASSVDYGLVDGRNVLTVVVGRPPDRSG